MLWLVVLGLALSLADALFLLVVAEHIGALQTVGLVVLTAFLGIILVRSEGAATLQRVQRRLQQGEAPTNEVIDGVMIVFGAALLITPGLLTDLTGFLLVIPVTRIPLRFVLRRWVVGPYFRRKIEEGTVNVQFGGPINFGAGGGPDFGSTDQPEWSRTDQVGGTDEDVVDLDDDAFRRTDDDES